MRASLYSLFVPRLEPEERTFRRQVARTALRGSFVILAIWLVSESAIILTSRMREGHALAYDAVAFSLLLLSLALAGRWLRRDRLIELGYLLALAYFAYPALNIFFAPGDLYLVNPAFLLSVLVAGAIVGPAAGYLFAACSILANLAGWLYAQGTAPPGYFPFDAATGGIFILVQGLVAIGSAAILHTLMSHIRQTIGRLHRQAEQMTELAHTDPLTSLANRRFFMDQLEREFARARRHHRPLSLIYLDLDGFKAINDRFGHLFGDDVLRGVSLSMQSILRSADLLARIGGDEFAVLLPETIQPGAVNVATKLRKALAAYVHQFGAALPSLTFCAGVAQLRESDTTIDDILGRADEAQYMAKTTGKDHTRTQTELPEPSRARPG
jgi:diguanylate cyclase (GGDEF)-like protein